MKRGWRSSIITGSKGISFSERKWGEDVRRTFGYFLKIILSYKPPTCPLSVSYSMCVFRSQILECIIVVIPSQKSRNAYLIIVLYINTSFFSFTRKNRSLTNNCEVISVSREFEWQTRSSIGLDDLIIVLYVNTSFFNSPSQGKREVLRIIAKQFQFRENSNSKHAAV